MCPLMLTLAIFISQVDPVKAALSTLENQNIKDIRVFFYTLQYVWWGSLKEINSVCFLAPRLARFYVDVQELLLNETEVQQLGRLWHEMSSFSNFMDTLRNNPYAVSGKGQIWDLLQTLTLLLSVKLQLKALFLNSVNQKRKRLLIRVSDVWLRLPDRDVKPLFIIGSYLNLTGNASYTMMFHNKAKPFWSCCFAHPASVVTATPHSLFYSK